MKQTRRPILIIAIGTWLAAGLYLSGAWIWVWPLLIVLSFRERRAWLIGLIVLRLVLMPQPMLGHYAGEAEIRPLDFTRDNQWQVSVAGQNYLYQGKLAAAGHYRIEGEIEGFRTNRSYTGYSEHDHYRSVGLIGRIRLEDHQLIEPRRPGAGFWLQDRLYRQLEAFKESQDLAFALLFGGSRLLERSFQQSLKEIGLLHLMVVSGLHLSIYDRSIDRLLKRLQVPRSLRRLVVLVFLSGLLLITGFHPSCVRSVGLVVLREYCFYTRRSIDRLDQLCLITWLMLLINPYWATGTGFLLGTLAHGSLVLPRRPSIRRLYLVMLPFQLLLNGVLSPFYVLANFALAALMDKALPVLALSLIIPWLQSVGHWWLSGLVRLISQLQRWDMLKLQVMMPSPWVVGLIMLYYLGLVLRLQSEPAFVFFQEKRHHLMLGLLCLIIGGQIAHGHSQVGVHFLDVAQGDAAVIVTTSGQRVLIDTGKTDRIFEHQRYLGIDSFDIVFITHRDDDHAYWVDELSFQTGYTSRYTPLGQFHGLAAGDAIEVDDVTFHILHPDRDHANENDNSLVILLEAYGDTFLFGGDIRGDLLQADWLAQTDVFKFPHHGSIHSLDETLTLQKDIPVIVLSYGLNDYQHPHPEVLAYFRDQALHQTFLEGSLHIYRGRFRRH
ncbi:MAG TPA: MBL fold metallo-hydrolase [Tissierellia bacterium]|nr:MBL fold metallo-hydrolase [Tissierellia bacterium]